MVALELLRVKVPVPVVMIEVVPALLSIPPVRVTDPAPVELIVLLPLVVAIELVSREPFVRVIELIPWSAASIPPEIVSFPVPLISRIF